MILESSQDRALILSCLDSLAEVCDPGTKVLVIGHVNDVLLYRELTRRGVSDYLIAPVTPLEVVIRADRSIMIRARDAKGAIAEERRVARADLARVIRERQAKNPDRPVVIAADKDVRYQAVLEVMDELQKQQVKRVGLLVKPAQ